MTARPINYLCTGGAMVPTPRMKALFDSQFTEGEEYPLGIVENASSASRGHYFVRLQEIFANLPETETRFPTWEHMRHWAVIEAGFCTLAVTSMDTPKDAKAMAAGVRQSDAYAVIIVRENVVRIARAKSQSRIAMKAEEFQKSKQAVLDICEALLPGLDRRELTKRVDHVAGPEKRPDRDPESLPERQPDRAPAGPTAPEGPTVGAEPNQRASEPPKAKRPETGEDYFAYCRDWATAEPDKGRRWQRWDSETDMRADLRVPIKRKIELTDLLKRLDKETS